MDGSAGLEVIVLLGAVLSTLRLATELVLVLFASSVATARRS